MHGFRADCNDFFHGWLNFQIEHHQWPQLSMLSYQKAAPEVRVVSLTLTPNRTPTPTLTPTPTPTLTLTLALPLTRHERAAHARRLLRALTPNPNQAP